ncbi:MAG: DUF2974 domain-containing protein [Ruminococcaceae bacterium]|nr:DUF2974 domain-containing protein [Oscillospiraceae bacterium]
MANELDYLMWRGDIPFSAMPLCEVDALIFSHLCYIDFGGIVPQTPSGEGITLAEAARAYLHLHRGEPAYIGAIVPVQIFSLLAKATKTVRFGQVRLLMYVNDVHEGDQRQFSALTLLLDDGTVFVAYRGTDDTLIGWKENFNMSFMHPVPAQTRAVAYVEEVAAARKGSLILGGHSKGGNLAVYAAVMASPSVRERIVRAYNHDGPGFTVDFLASEAYRSMRHKLCTLIPQSSVVGLLLEHEEEYEVVKSTQTGLWQHDAFSWEVMGCSFVRVGAITEDSRLIDKTLKSWLSEVPTEEREAFVDAVYETLVATNAATLTDLNNDKRKLVKAWGALDSDSRAVVMRVLRTLFKQGTKNVLEKNKRKS